MSHSAGWWWKMHRRGRFRGSNYETDWTIQRERPCCIFIEFSASYSTVLFSVLDYANHDHKECHKECCKEERQGSTGLMDGSGLGRANDDRQNHFVKGACGLETIEQPVSTSLQVPSFDLNLSYITLGSAFDVSLWSQGWFFFRLIFTFEE